ncbi:hypothetical protein IPJ70_02740 [Candidatus Campbellbacteria bacterium]|nr:MAG: hypothetical protein IPJ70_02740 [Candidatus Campbellbacteria bacterium]
MNTIISSDIVVPFIGFVLFFIVQATGRTSEKALTLTILLLSGGIFVLHYNAGETALFLLGLAFGLIIEIGLRKLGSQQKWSRASLLGIPYWLPFAWGIGFVVITRLGLFVRTLFL